MPSGLRARLPWAAGVSHHIGWSYGQCVALGSPVGDHCNGDASHTQDYYALDFDLALDEYVYPMAAGTLVYAGPSGSGYGTIVLIKHMVGADDYESLYTHLDSVDPSLLSGGTYIAGKTIDANSPIGKAGSSGTSSVHLHFALYKGASLSLGSYNGPYGGQAVVPEPLVGTGVYENFEWFNGPLTAVNIDPAIASDAMPGGTWSSGSTPNGTNVGPGGSIVFKAHVTSSHPIEEVHLTTGYAGWATTSNSTTSFASPPFPETDIWRIVGICHPGDTCWSGSNTSGDVTIIWTPWSDDGHNLVGWLPVANSAVPTGPSNRNLCISFDVYDTSGARNLAPNGTHCDKSSLLNLSAQAQLASNFGSVSAQLTDTADNGARLITLNAAAASGDWTQFHNGPSHEGYNTAETTLSPSNVVDLGVAWTGSTGVTEYSSPQSSPAVVNGVLYIGSFDKKLYAYAVGCGTGGGTCTPLWTATTGSYIDSSPAVVNGVVYIGSIDHKLYAFDAAGLAGCSGNPRTCTPLWTASFGSTPSSPAVANGVLYVSSGYSIYAFDAAGVTGCSGSPKTCLPLWTATTGYWIQSSPAVANGVVYVGSDDNKLYAFDATGMAGCSGSPRTCAPLWTAITGSAILSPPTIANGVIYVGSNDGKLYALDAAGVSGCSGSPKTCTPLWTAATGGWIQSSPAVANGVVYVGSDDKKLYAFDATGMAGCSGSPRTCAPLWTAITGSSVESSPAVANGVVYAASMDSKLYAFDATGMAGCSGSPRTCAPLWTGSTGWDIYSSPAVSNGRIYVGSWDDKIYAFGLDHGALDHLVLSPASATIAPGGSQVYTAAGYDQYGNSWDVTSSTTFTMAGVGSCTGTSCTSTAAGDHVVTGTDGTATGTATLHVNVGSLDHLVLSPPSATITAGGSQAYTAESYDSYGNAIRDVTAGVAFSIAGGGFCTGPLCTSVVAGDHAVTGTYVGVTSTATLHVDPGSLDHLVLSPTSATIAVGGSQVYAITGADAYGNGLGDVSASTTLAIAGGGSCTGSSCTSTVSGNHTVTGSFGGVRGTAILGVHPGSLDHLVLSPPNASITAGDSQAYMPTGYDSYGNSWNDTSSSLSISGGGSCNNIVHTCTSTVPGDHTVTGTDGTATDTATLHVNVGPLDHLVLSPASAIITAGGSQAYTASGADQYGNSQGDVTSASALNISGGGSCNNTAHTCTSTVPGDHTITVTDGSASGTATLHVNVGSLNHLVLSPSGATIAVGGSQVYTAIGYDLHGNSLGDVTGATTFTVAGGGSCTDTSCTSTVPGDHTVTGTDGSATGTTSLHVNAQTVPGKPTGVLASTGDSSVAISWTAPASNGGSAITSYTVTSSPGAKTCVWSTGPLSCTVSGLTNGTPYTFTVTATNSVGTGPASDPSNSVTPQGVTGSTFHPITPVRLLDTRSGNGSSGPLQPFTPRTFQITGRDVIPAGATAVTGNLTVTDETESWAVYLGPDPIAHPTSSTLNFVKGDVTANGVTVALSSGGSLSATYMAPAGNTTNLVFDVTGYFTPDDSGATYHPITPVRLLDSRHNNGLSTPLPANTPKTFQITGRLGIPTNATAVTGNLTVTDQTASWAVFLGPNPTASPTSSTINFIKGDVKANGVTVALGSGGTLSATYMAPAGSTTNLVFDVTGYFTADLSGSKFVPISPARLLDTRSGNGLSNPLSTGIPVTFQVTGRGGVPTTATAVTGNLTVTDQTNSWAIFLGPIPTASPTSSTLNFAKGDVRANNVTVALGTGGTLSATYMAPAGSKTALVFDVTGYFVGP